MNLRTIYKHILTAIISGSICAIVTVHIINWQHKINDQKNELLTTIPPLNSFPTGVSDTDLKRFWKVWNIIQEKYIEKETIKKEQLLEGATQGMVAALHDPYSEFLTLEKNQKVKEAYAGTLSGVGIELGLNSEKKITALAAIKGSPAEKAGIMHGDTIWAIDGNPTINMSLTDAANKIRGKKGTKVKLLIQRNQEEPFEIELIRDTIQLKTINAKEIENGIMYIQITRMGDNTIKEWEDIVEKIMKNKLKKIILDIRNNTGGYLETAVHINSDFVTGLLFKQVDAKSNTIQYNTIHKPRLTDTQIVILVNKGTASSAEIVAAVLQEKGRAKIVGEQTYGKGIVQEKIELDEGTGLQLTIAKWVLPSGKSIHQTGVTPDYEVKITKEKNKNRLDEQLEKAKELLQ